MTIANIATTGAIGRGTQTACGITADSVTCRTDLGAFGPPVHTVRVVSLDGGTEIMRHIDSDTGFNPMLRAVRPFLDRMMGPAFNRALENPAEASA